MIDLLVKRLDRLDYSRLLALKQLIENDRSHERSPAVRRVKRDALRTRGPLRDVIVEMLGVAPSRWRRRKSGGSDVTSAARRLGG